MVIKKVKGCGNMKHLNLVVTETQPETAQSAVMLLNKYNKNTTCGEDITVSFSEDINCLGDEYRIDVKENEISVFANTAVGFNAAVGYLVRHQQTAITNQKVTFNSDFRAVYFANHFYNYYHSAPTEKICEYLESLALWGQNALVLWFDMHHFESLSDPAAQQMIEKMLRLFQKARSLGMKTSLTRLANEYYIGAKPELLAENKLDSGLYHQKLCGFYYTEICSSKAEGEELLLTSFDELLSCFDSVGLDYLMFWPYDQGGCTCESCYPWGANGFYKLAKKHAEITKKHFPDANIIFSCWRFDSFTHGEWDKALEIIKADGTWIDYLMVDIAAPLPANLSDIGKPILSFPEISMYNVTPWGGFGANPFPKALFEQFQNTKSFCRGGALYSEGIFEDINKAISLKLMQDPDISPEQIILEYCTYHFGKEHADAITDIILRSESTLKRVTRLSTGEEGEYPLEKPTSPHTFEIEYRCQIIRKCHKFSF